MTDPVEFPPNTGEPVSAWSGRIDKGARLAAPSADMARVMFCFDGMMRVETDQDRWFIPDRHGIWLPPGLLPGVLVADPIEFQIFQVHARPLGALGLPDGPVVLRATPLIRGIGRRMMEPETMSPDQHRRLAWVALDEIGRLEQPDLHLPGSGDPRLARVMAHLLNHPRESRSLARLAALVGSSERTLSRLFRTETGMSWREWRDRMRFVLALEGLQAGRSSTEIAAQLGYAGTSAFVAAFRRQGGMTPTEWRHRH